MTSKLTYSYLFAIIIFLSSCSAAYKMGQTPDDVYYSPAPPQQDGYVTSYTEDDQNSYAYNNNIEDLAIRRGISDPVYRSSLSFGYGFMPYDYFDDPFMNPYGMYSPYSSFYPFNYYYPYTAGITFYPYSAFNYYGGYYPGYNYYYPSTYYYDKISTGGNYGITPRRVNLNAYRPGTTTRIPITTTGSNTTAPVRTFTQQRPQTSGFGGMVRRIFTPANNGGNTTNSNSNNERSFRPEFSAPTRSSGGSTGGSSGGGGGGSVRTFRH
ncbi:MAG TPA: hypothetical protein VG847_14310 [Chitinophagaceae bacterium]|nr:hypothetical protein [Chitinophagaceae bacterium]